MHQNECNHHHGVYVMLLTTWPCIASNYCQGRAGSRGGGGGVLPISVPLELGAIRNAAGLYNYIH